MGMNELQREMILAERAEKRDLERERRERLRNAKLVRQNQQASQQVNLQLYIASAAWLLCNGSSVFPAS